MNKDRILELLSKSNIPISGETISKELGVSRTAIWKSIEYLRKEGYEIASSTKLGYSLVSSPDDLRSGAIKAHVDAELIGKNIVSFDTIDSTNSEVKRRLTDSVEEGLVIVSDEQTGGRGRRGNSFVSPKGKGLYISLVLCPHLMPYDTTDITAWIAVSVCEAISKITDSNPKIKWTNDIILNNRKLAGILTEMEIEAESGYVRYIVTGIGINCNQTSLDFEGELSEKATSIFIETGKKVKRSVLAAEIINSIDKMMKKYPTEKKTYLDMYKDNCITLNKEVLLLSPDGSSTSAFAKTIDDNFSLIVQLENGEIKTVLAGEVSVRGLLGYT